MCPVYLVSFTRFLSSIRFLRFSSSSKASLVSFVSFSSAIMFRNLCLVFCDGDSYKTKQFIISN